MWLIKNWFQSMLIKSLKFIFTCQILLKFVQFELKKPNECEKNFIDIFPDKTDLPSRWVCLFWSLDMNKLSKYSLTLIKTCHVNGGCCCLQLLDLFLFEWVSVWLFHLENGVLEAVWMELKAVFCKKNFDEVFWKVFVR